VERGKRKKEHQLLSTLFAVQKKGELVMVVKELQSPLKTKEKVKKC
jgi:hypothetical protein